MDEFFDALAEINRAHDLSSDRQTAKKLGITSSSLSAFRKRKSFPCDGTIMTVSELAGLDPKMLLAAVHADRNAGTAAALPWLEMAKTFAEARLTV